jgi:hypothetical protein
VFEPVAFRLGRIPIEHLLCIYNIRTLHKCAGASGTVRFGGRVLNFDVHLPIVCK